MRLAFLTTYEGAKADVTMTAAELREFAANIVQLANAPPGPREGVALQAPRGFVRFIRTETPT